MRRALCALLLAGCGGGGGDPTVITLDGGVEDGAVVTDAAPVDRDAGADASPPPDAGESPDGAVSPPDAAACTPTGFANAGRRWSLPDGLEGPLRQLAGGGVPQDCNQMKYGLANLRGEGLDLVVTHDCEQGSGHRFWRVYGNDGSGFASAGSRWTLPEGFDPNTFTGFGGASPNCQEPSYSLIDLRGQGRPDLVVTFDCERGSGESFWRVYRNTGNGFANAGVRWPLPPGFGAEAFVGLAAIHENDCNQPSYSLLDLTADGLPDMVVSYDCEMGTGRTHWWVYPNTGEGFAQAPRRWTIPMLTDDPLVRFANVRRDTCDDPSYSLADLDGDGALDLVLTHDCENGSAQTHWRVFRNQGDGFARANVRWSLPNGFGPRTFYGMAHVEPGNACDPPSFALLDLTHDGRADLVITHDCEDMGSATSTWRVYENQGDGFASAGRLWSLPDGFDDNLFHTVSRADPNNCAPPTFSVLDLSGDGRLEVVVTWDCERGSGDSFWRTYSASCQ